jgi:hypothetical protein
MRQAICSGKPKKQQSRKTKRNEKRTTIGEGQNHEIVSGVHPRKMTWNSRCTAWCAEMRFLSKMPRLRLLQIGSGLGNFMCMGRGRGKDIDMGTWIKWS